MISRERGDSDYWPTSRLVISKPGESVMLQQLGIVDARVLLNLVDADREHFARFGSEFADNVNTIGDAITSIGMTRPDRLRFGIWADGQLRGETGLTYRANARAEVSYWVGSEHTRQGYASRAQKLLAEWSFESGRLDYLYATIHVDNLASRGVAENAGFVADEQEDEVIRYIKTKSMSEQR